MNTKISSKLTALILALTLNSMIVAGVAAMFDLQIHSRTATHSQSTASRPSTYAVV